MFVYLTSRNDLTDLGGPSSSGTGQLGHEPLDLARREPAVPAQGGQMRDATFLRPPGNGLRRDVKHPRDVGRPQEFLARVHHVNRHLRPAPALALGPAFLL